MKLILQTDTQREILTEDIWLFENTILQDPAVKPLQVSALTGLFHRISR